MFSWERDKANPLPEKPKPKPCKHGNVYACGHCMAEAAPKCKHGNPFYCGFCGPMKP
jgi:hypothetical protein